MYKQVQICTYVMSQNQCVGGEQDLSHDSDMTVCTMYNIIYIESCFK